MNANGMNWIRQEKRLALYLRDGLSCCYCGQSIEEGISLTLDHVAPRSRGGGHGSANLVTACRRCNDVRQDRPLKKFCESVAAYLNGGITPAQILAHVRACLRRPLPLAEAKTLIARRGSAARAIAALAKTR